MFGSGSRFSNFWPTGEMRFFGMTFPANCGYAWPAAKVIGVFVRAVPDGLAKYCWKMNTGTLVQVAQ